MKIKQVVVNWVLDDEELLEPYEWEADDDLELLEEIEVYHVDRETIYHLYYCQLVLEVALKMTIAIFSDGFHSIVVEFDEENNLKYRSLLSLKARESLKDLVKQLPKTKLVYNILSYGENKELGLTRLEREKKQYIYQWLSELFYSSPNDLMELSNEFFLIKVIDEKQVYQTILEKLDKGYSSLHEMLYLEFVKGI
jgi:Protein of unknown function (DUF3603).